MKLYFALKVTFFLMLLLMMILSHESQSEVEFRVVIFFLHSTSHILFQIYRLMLCLPAIPSKNQKCEPPQLLVFEISLYQIPFTSPEKMWHERQKKIFHLVRRCLAPFTAINNDNNAVWISLVLRKPLVPCLAGQPARSPPE